MRDLEGGDRSPCGDKGGYRCQSVALPIVPDAEAVRGDPGFGRHMRRFSKDNARAADRAAAEVDAMPIIRHAVGSGVLAHRRHHDAIAYFDRSHNERTKQMRVTVAFQDSAAVFRHEQAGSVRFRQKDSLALSLHPSGDQFVEDVPEENDADEEVEAGNPRISFFPDSQGEKVNSVFFLEERVSFKPAFSGDNRGNHVLGCFPFQSSVVRGSEEILLLNR